MYSTVYRLKTCSALEAPASLPDIPMQPVAVSPGPSAFHGRGVGTRGPIKFLAAPPCTGYLSPNRSTQDTYSGTRLNRPAQETPLSRDLPLM